MNYRKSVDETIGRSARLFQEAVWPMIRVHLAATQLRAVEATAGGDLHDKSAGIDYWMADRRGGVFGLASRVRWPDRNGKIHRSFTPRCSIASGGKTELDKYLASLERAGSIYPHLNIAAFFDEHEDLWHVGIARTSDIATFASYRRGTYRTNSTDGNGFIPVDWDEFALAGRALAVLELRRRDNELVSHNGGLEAMLDG